MFNEILQRRNYPTRISESEALETAAILQSLTPQSPWTPDYENIYRRRLTKERAIQQTDLTLIAWLRFLDSAESGYQQAVKAATKRMITVDYPAIAAFNDFCSFTADCTPDKLMPSLRAAKRVFHSLLSENGRGIYWDTGQPDAWVYEPVHEADFLTTVGLVNKSTLFSAP